MSIEGERLAAIGDQVTAIRLMVLSHFGAIAVAEPDTFDMAVAIARSQRECAAKSSRPVVAMHMDAMLADLGELRALAVG